MLTPIDSLVDLLHGHIRSLERSRGCLARSANVQVPGEFADAVLERLTGLLPYLDLQVTARAGPARVRALTFPRDP